MVSKLESSFTKNISESSIFIYLFSNNSSIYLFNRRLFLLLDILKFGEPWFSFHPSYFLLILVLDLPPNPQPISLNPTFFVILFFRNFEAKTHADIPPPIINKSYLISLFIGLILTEIIFHFLKNYKQNQVSLMNKNQIQLQV